MMAGKYITRDLILGRPEPLARCLRTPDWGTSRHALLVIVLGCGLYGASVGWWRSPLMGLYSAIKLPAIIFLTLGVNALLNGMLGQLLGSGLSFRQTGECLLLSFAAFAVITGSLAPVSFFLAHHGPAPGETGAAAFHQRLLLGHVLVIAWAGVIATHRLMNLLRAWCPDQGTAWRTLVGWLAGNLFAGAQISYLLRPVFGTPDLPVQFLRPDAFRGSFYESVWWALTQGR